MGIKDFFFKAETDEAPVKTPIVTKPTFTSVQSPSSIKSSEFPVFNTSALDSSEPVSGVKKQEIVDYFKKVFEENNIPGADYQEFKNALEDMKTQAMDEATKYKTLWISFKSMGLTTQKLIETAGTYKNIFADKLNQFDAELQSEFDEQVGNKQKEVDSIADDNKKIDDDMKALNAKRLENDEKVKSLNSEIQKNTASLTTQKNDWHTTYNDVIKEIDLHVELINKYLVTI